MRRQRSCHCCSLLTVPPAPQEVETGAVDACQVAVARNGRLAGMATFGRTPGGAAATDTTLFSIFSCTKLTVAIAMWQLLEEGRVQLTDTVAQHEYWLEYGRAMLGAMAKVDKRHGAFLTNCPGHCATAGSAFLESAFPGTNLKAAVLQWLPEAIANGTQPGWSAPRWQAQEGQKCTHARA